MIVTVCDYNENDFQTISLGQSSYMFVNCFQDKQYELIMDNIQVISSTDKSNVVDVFKKLSNKMLNVDEHYMIVKNANGKYDVIPYDPLQM